MTSHATRSASSATAIGCTRTAPPGADNGVALALGAAIAENRELRRPRIELLFTVDEETGLTGVKNLSPGLFEGRLLINLDSETEGVFTVGCAAAGMSRSTAVCASNRCRKATVGCN